ncbi:hypothetical protein KXX06_004838, partial [Aspergillus fumigatus]
AAYNILFDMLERVRPDRTLTYDKLDSVTIHSSVTELPGLKAGIAIVPIDPTQLLVWVGDIVHQTVA